MMSVMYLTLEGYTEMNKDGKIVANPRTIAYCLPFPAFPISPYTLYSSDDNVYYFSLSTQSGDVTVAQLHDLYNRFYRYVFLINRAIISRHPPKLKLLEGMYTMIGVPKSVICTLFHVDITVFSYRFNHTTFLGRRQSSNTELQLIALQATDEHQLDMQLAKNAYYGGRMSARGYWYVAA